MPVDMLMAFSGESSFAWIEAEGQSVLTTEEKKNGATTLFKDSLAQDFQAGRFFDVEDFSLGVGLEDRSEVEMDRLGDQKLLDRAMKMIDRDNKEKAGTKHKSSKQKFDKWMRGRTVEKRKGGSEGYPLDFQEFEITRRMDKASVYLFDACCKCWTLKKAALLKRKPSGRNIPQTFFRIDFRDILITSVDWEIDEVVKEKLKFICRAAKVTYRQQLNTGEMGPPKSRQWDPLGKFGS